MTPALERLQNENKLFPLVDVLTFPTTITEESQKAYQAKVSKMCAATVCACVYVCLACVCVCLVTVCMVCVCVHGVCVCVRARARVAVRPCVSQLYDTRKVLKQQTLNMPADPHTSVCEHVCERGGCTCTYVCVCAYVCARVHVCMCVCVCLMYAV